MPRVRRYESPGAVHHVILRGNQGRPIFYSDAERCRFCLLLQEGVERYGHRILAFCLMSNHVHLAIQQGEQGLSKAMQNITFRHAQRVNRVRQEVGHVFQGRYKAIRVDSEQYLLQLVRYIHLNPVRAGMVEKPEDYKWSGHNNFLGTDPITWLDRDWVLSQISEERSKAIQLYRDFVYAGIGKKPECKFETGNQAGILGDDDFIQEILDFECGVNPLQSEISLDELVDFICEKYHVSKNDLSSVSKIKILTHVRGVLSLLIRESETFSLAELGKLINRDPSGLSQLANRFALKKEEAFQVELSGFRKLLRGENSE